MAQLRYGIVGDGRVAHHIRSYFSLKKIGYTQWSRRLEEAEGLRAGEAFAQVSVILVLIKDDAIATWVEAFKRAHPELASKTFVHFSGSLAVNGVEAWHPLMSFSSTSQSYDLKTYESIAFVGSSGGRDFRELFPELSNPHYQIAPEKRALYHALCVMAGNFSVLLWRKLFESFEFDLKLPRDAAFPYMARIFANTISQPHSALTGPLQRRDRKTVQSNLDALEGDAYAKVYEAFVRAQFPEFFKEESL